MSRSFEIAYANHALEHKTNALVPGLIIISPIRPAQAQIIIAGRHQDLSMVRRPDGYYVVSSLLWSDAEIHLHIGDIKGVLIKHFDHVNCVFHSKSRVVITKQTNTSIKACAPVKQDFVQLHLGDVFDIQQV
jgi:hypothetical protein